MPRLSQPLIDEDFLLPIAEGNQSERRRLSGFRSQHGYGGGSPGGPRRGGFWFILMHYVVWPIVGQLLGRLSRLLVVALMLKFFLGIDFLTMWQVGTWAWNVAASGAIANEWSDVVSAMFRR